MNKLLLHLLILFQVLNLQMIRCFKEDSSLIQILTDTDLVLTLTKFLSIAHIEQESTTIKEMDQLQSMEIKAVVQIMSLIHMEAQLKIHQRNGISKLLLELLVDSLTNTLMIIMNNQEFCLEKLCLRQIELILLRTSLVH